ncbi:IclR family transcriptional regulator [Curtobacterium sp. PhB130]|uniref:helix-turn-helix domain-containing protein n=1 Tax=unclassified Curtobacterium TaxID=257496 RepID=UPI000F928581|nr:MULTISPECIES: helix-turn-helix domain-containing protein [unclassified Curtobacterium]ROP63560.1 IclR family transcriptional regulator [Curtobacterium sp. ZW137]ROS77821.1 IclR family transcriptional regulator [Curtobacterium sp. PhB130]TCK65964.1 IclR family transcriptional regulator [Curtobacterium sp. PhB136]
MSEPGLRARQPKAIQNALSVLEAVAHAGPGVTAQQISDVLGMPRATTYRLITLLVEDEYLVRLPDLRGFALGHKVAELAGVGSAAVPGPAASPLPRAVRAVLGDVRSAVRAGVHLARYDATGITDIDVDPDFPLLDEAALRSSPGRSAMGRLHAAGGGSAVQVGTFARGFGCLALPVLGERGELVAGLTLSAPSSRIEAPGSALASLRAAVARLEPLLA